jgi:hypothetical protein
MHFLRFNPDILTSSLVTSQLPVFPMVLDRESADARPTATDRGSVVPPPQPRKRRRKITEPTPDAPAHHTRSATGSQTTLAPTTTYFIPHLQPAPPLPHVHPPVRKTPKKKIQAVTKPAAQVYRYLPRDMPNDLGGLPVCSYRSSA